jgi:hypothetical protein
MYARATMTAASTLHASSSLRNLLDSRAPAKEIESFLDSLAPAARVQEVLSVTGKGVGRLYHAVADAPPLTLEEIVPQGAKGTIIYEGRNSLPLFSRFQKRFTRLQDGTIIGYNHQTMSPLTGPGYFVVKPATGEGELGKELYFDYTEPPPAVVPPGWPESKPNDRGFSKAVYMNMKDYMRRVARGIIVGKAYKLGVDQKAYFSLSLPA